MGFRKRECRSRSIRDEVNEAMGKKRLNGKNRVNQKWIKNVKPDGNRGKESTSGFF